MWSSLKDQDKLTNKQKMLLERKKKENLVTTNSNNFEVCVIL